MLSGNFLMLVGVKIYILSRCLYIVMRPHKRHEVKALREILLFLFVGYLCVVGSITFFPLMLQHQVYAEVLTRNINIIPLKEIINDIQSIGTAYGGDTWFMIKLIARNVGGNILLFVPFGLLLPLLWNRFKSFVEVIILALIASIAIETIQLLIMSLGLAIRIVDIDDVICNVLGACIGYGIFYFYAKLFGKGINQVSIQS